MFKYFEKRAKDGLPDPLSSRVPSDESVGQPKGIPRGMQGITEQTDVVHTIGAIVTQYFMPVTRHGYYLVNKTRFLKIFVLKYFHGYP